MTSSISRRKSAGTDKNRYPKNYISKNSFDRNIDEIEISQLTLKMVENTSSRVEDQTENRSHIIPTDLTPNEPNKHISF